MSVNARHLLVRNKTLGQDPRVDLVLNEPNGVEAKLYEECKALYLTPLSKMYIESCLLASSDLGAIEEVLETPRAVLEAYRHYFFEVLGLNRLAKLGLVDDAKTDEEKTMKLWGLSQGLDFVSWRIGRPTNISPVDGLQELHTLCVYKSKEALFSGNASESSKEATKWIALATTLARLLKVWIMDSNAAKHDIQIALKTLKPEFSSFENLPETKISSDGIPEIPSLPRFGGELKVDLGDGIGDLNQLDKN